MGTDLWTRWNLRIPPISLETLSLPPKGPNPRNGSVIYRWKALEPNFLMVSGTQTSDARIQAKSDSDSDSSFYEKSDTYSRHP